VSGEDAGVAAAPTRPQHQLRRTRIAKARRQPAQAAAKGAPLPSGATGAREMRERPQGRGALLAVSLETGFTPVLEGMAPAIDFSS